MRFVVFLFLAANFISANQSLADDKRAQVNYMLNCQGCHTPNGEGFPERGVPSLKDFMGQFLLVPGGREFLIQVPGAAQSTLDSHQLAEMTNWMLKTFDPDSLKPGFRPYGADEVDKLRSKKLVEVSATRKALVDKIQRLEKEVQLTVK